MTTTHLLAPRLQTTVDRSDPIRGRRVEITCPSAETGELVKVTAWPAADSTLMVLAPRGGFRLSREHLDILDAALPATDDGTGRDNAV